MTIKDLKEKLNEFDENLQVYIISGSSWDTGEDEITTVNRDKYHNKVYIY